jgi:hypothetical protein
MRLWSKSAWQMLVLTRSVRLVGITPVLEHHCGLTGTFASRGVAHLDTSDGTDGRLHEILTLAESLSLLTLTAGSVTS